MSKFRCLVEMKPVGRDGQEITGEDLYEEVYVTGFDLSMAEIQALCFDYDIRIPTGKVQIFDVTGL